VEIRNIRDVAEQVMTKADQEGLIVRNVLEGSCLAPSEGEPVRLNEDDAVFTAQGEWHGVSNNTDQSAVTLIIYAGAGSLEEAGYEEHPRQFDGA
jgi:quercetin dioxygenase-like cupin family protein